MQISIQAKFYYRIEFNSSQILKTCRISIHSIIIWEKDNLQLKISKWHACNILKHDWIVETNFLGGHDNRSTVAIASGFQYDVLKATWSSSDVPDMTEPRKDHACLYIELETKRGILVTGGEEKYNNLTSCLRNSIFHSISFNCVTYLYKYMLLRFGRKWRCFGFRRVSGSEHKEVDKNVCAQSRENGTCDVIGLWNPHCNRR